MADVNEKLRKTAKSGVEIELKALLGDPRCDALSKDDRGWTALMWAAYQGHEACLKLLLTRSDALSKDNCGMTALMRAALNGHEACVRLMLTKLDCDALSQDDDGMTALMWAACYGHEACVGMLLPASDPLAEDKGGLTASTWARNRSYESVARFIEAYTLAKNEHACIEASSGIGIPGRRSAPRV